MATKTEVIRTDDLTGETGDDVQNWTFALSGTTYEVDLGQSSYEKLVEAFRPFTDAGRPVAGGTTRRASPNGARPPRPSEASPAQAVRAWARGQGIDVPPRGRVPRGLIERWEQAGSPS